MSRSADAGVVDVIKKINLKVTNNALGIIPMNLEADALEWVPGCKGGLGCEDEPGLNSFPIVYSSDAHSPDDIGQRYASLEVDNLCFRDIKEGLKMLLNTRKAV